MYSLEVRIYQPPGQLRVYAELYADKQTDPECLATAHITRSQPAPALPFNHPAIIAGVREVCAEIAENFGYSLF